MWSNEETWLLSTKRKPNVPILMIRFIKATPIHLSTKLTPLWSIVNLWYPCIRKRLGRVTMLQHSSTSQLPQKMSHRKLTTAKMPGDKQWQILVNFLWSRANKLRLTITLRELNKRQEPAIIVWTPCDRHSQGRLWVQVAVGNDISLIYQYFVLIYFQSSSSTKRLIWLCG